MATEADKPAPFASEAYANLDVRRAVFGFLSRQSLAKCMRVHKDGMEEVMREVYHTMEYNTVVLRKNQIAIQCKTRDYSSHVRIINAHTITLPFAILRKIGVDKDAFKGYKAREKQALWLREYRPDVFNLIVPRLRRQFPLLRGIRFGCGSGKEENSDRHRWVVYLQASSAGAASPSSVVDQPIGHIEINQRLVIHADAAPPTPLFPAFLPPREYSISTRFDLAFFCGRNQPDLHVLEAWRVAFRDWPEFSQLYQRLDAYEYPLSASDLGALCRRQIEAGHSDRLDYVRSYGAPWCATDFRLLDYSGASITSLVLAHGFEEDKVYIDFADCPELFLQVKQQLPNLDYFDLAIKGIAEAETVCLGLLSDRTLTEYGSIRHLRIYTPPYLGNLLNVLRLPPTFAPKAARSMSVRQSPSRRAFLGSVDFETLGVTCLNDFYDLEYHDDGRPQDRWDTQTSRWAEQAISGLEVARSEVFPKLEAGLAEYGVVAGRLREMKQSGGSDEAMLEESEKVLEAVRQVRRAIKQARALLANDPEDDIEEFMELLRDRMGEQE